ncbi:hypothetical protein J4G07_22100 [Candidatus Poribacteria bacterium]|nr:hypothetical protein [Candidatus Poribacteria bacterium]
MVHRFSAHDGMGYENIYEMAEAAIKDGFPELENIHTFGLGSFGCIWSFRSVLKLIRDSHHISMLFIDDFYIRQPISDFNHLLSFLPSDDFKMLQVRYWHSDEVLYSDTVEVYEKCPELYKGLRGAGDNVTILSPMGASYLLSWMDKYPDLYLETIIHMLAHQDPQETGCYSVVDIPKWYGYDDEIPDHIDRPLEEQDRKLADRKGIIHSKMGEDTILASGGGVFVP